MVHITSKSIVVALSLLLFTASSALAVGQTYYVSNTGGDANSGTSVNSAWQSLAKVNSTSFSPGDQVLFQRGGTWTGSLVVSSSGSSTSPITFGAYGSGDNPVIRNPGGTWNRAINLRGSYLIIEQFLLKDTSEAGVFVESGAEHNIIRHNQGTTLGQGVVLKGNHTTVTHNYFHDLVMVINTDGGGDDFGANGIVIRSANNEISYNQITRAIAASFDYGYDGGGIEIYSTNQSMDNNFIHHNQVSDSMGFIEIGSRDGQSVADNIIAYNLSLRNQKFASIHLGTTGFGSLTTNLRVENNTIYEPENTGKRIFWIWSPAVPTTLSLTNNIVYSAVKFGDSNQIGFNHSHNLFFMVNGASLGLNPDPSDIVGLNPQFVNPDQDNFHLQASSPALDQGVNLGYTSDLDNLPVPVGQPDLGAYELQSPTPIPGDANQDGVVDQADFTIWFNHYQTVTSQGYSAGDFDLDTHVDGVDYVIWLNHL